MSAERTVAQSPVALRALCDINVEHAVDEFGPMYGMVERRGREDEEPKVQTGATDALRRLLDYFQGSTENGAD